MLLFRYYDKLANILPGSASTKLTASADNIVTIVAENYRVRTDQFMSYVSKKL